MIIHIYVLYIQDSNHEHYIFNNIFLFLNFTKSKTFTNIVIKSNYKIAVYIISCHIKLKNPKKSRKKLI